MRNQRWVKKEFLGRWMSGLKKYRWEKKKRKMDLMERKKAIKLSADIAMASTREKSTRWSRALIAKAASSSDLNTKLLADHVLASSSDDGDQQQHCQKKPVTNYYSTAAMICFNRRRRKILARSVRTVQKERVMSRLVDKRRRRRLKSLLPGGEFMDDDMSLIEETLDYIQSLTAQVQVMRGLLTAASS